MPSATLLGLLGAGIAAVMRYRRDHELVQVLPYDAVDPAIGIDIPAHLRIHMRHGGGKLVQNAALFSQGKRLDVPRTSVIRCISSFTSRFSSLPPLSGLRGFAQTRLRVLRVALSRRVRAGVDETFWCLM